MKIKTTPKSFTNNYYFLILISIFTAIVSCEKNKEIKNSSYLNIKQINIENYVEITQKGLASNSNEDKNKSSEISYYDNFDAITDLSIQIPTDSIAFNKLKIKNALTTRKIHSSTLRDTVKYRLIFFKDNIKIQDFTIQVGQKPQIALEPGTTYKWIAYSINSSSVPDCPNNIISKNDLANKDFIFANGTIKIKETDNNLTIDFKRLTTQYEIKLDTRGLFAKNIQNKTKVSVRNSNTRLFTKADFNIFDGIYSSTHDSISTPEGILSTYGNDTDQKQITFYSSQSLVTSAADDLKLFLNPLSLTMDDNSTREFKNTTLNLRHNAITGDNTRGKKFTIEVKFIESGIKTSNDPNAPTWARSNLWYNDKSLSNKYRFRVSPFFRDTESLITIIQNYPAVLSDVNDMWKNGSPTPGGTVPPVIAQRTDPCTLVYPEGTWKLPSADDFRSLAQKPDSAYLMYRGEPWIPGLMGLVGNNQFYELGFMYKGITNSNSAFGKPYLEKDNRTHSKNLYFSGVGYKNISNNIINRPIAASLLSIYNIVGVANGLTGGGYYWTNTSAIVNSYQGFLFIIYGGSALSIDVELLKLSLLNIDANTRNSNSPLYSYSNYNFNTRMNIRCVRN